jgi:indole-3-glycerol phosphate synthase
MNILEKIIEHKKKEVAERKKKIPEGLMKQSALYNRKIFSLKASLLDITKTGIIAEYKRKSPSKGIINDTASVADVTKGYTANGASALSILTDEHFFGGKSADLEAARFNNIPILRKDFIIDEFQVTEARSIGADAILLIAANLTPGMVKKLAIYAKSIDLEVVLEIHDEDELKHICEEIDVVGVNNRNLKTFEVDIETSIRLSKLIPAGKIKISESGITEVSTINLLKQNGFNGFLVGEAFMKEAVPAVAFATFVQQLNNQ